MMHSGKYTGLRIWLSNPNTCIIHRLLAVYKWEAEKCKKRLLYMCELEPN